MARKKKKSEPRTLVGIVLDKSGSMNQRSARTIDAMNEYINTLRLQGEGEIIASMIQFDSPGGSPHFEATYTMTPIKDVPDLGHHNYKPRGLTPLYDAIGRMIRTIEGKENNDDKVVIVIQTDGLENDSREFTREGVRALRDDKEASGWEFVFLGTGEQAWAAGQNLGFRAAQTVNYGTQDVQDHTDAVYLVSSASVTSTKQARGSRAAESFLAASPEKTRLEGKAKGKKTPA